MGVEWSMSIDPAWLQILHPYGSSSCVYERRYYRRKPHLRSLPRYHQSWHLHPLY